MKKSLSIPFAARATSLKNLLNSISFRLTAWYAGIFTVSLFAAFVSFYMLVLRGSQNIPRQMLSGLREDFREYFGVMLLSVLFVAAFVGWILARRALSRVEEISRTAADISLGALERRVPVSGRRDEIDGLAEQFNGMVDRIGGLIRDMKEVNDNIAHDLRSPITRMRAAAEMALTNDDAPAVYQAMAGTVIEECDRLLTLINTMLDIAEAEAGIAGLSVREADVGLLARDALDLFSPLIEEKNIRADFDQAGPLSLNADIQKIQRILGNLLDNAIKFTPEGGSIHVSALGTDREVSVSIRDTGPGIPEAELAHIFDRFFRGEKSRSTPGCGLGLSLARAFVRSHGGEITAQNAPGGGSEFTVILPKTRRG